MRVETHDGISVLTRSRKETRVLIWERSRILVTLEEMVPFGQNEPLYSHSSFSYVCI